jgi:hypothetical protein
MKRHICAAASFTDTCNHGSEQASVSGQGTNLQKLSCYQGAARRKTPHCLEVGFKRPYQQNLIFIRKVRTQRAS